MIPETNLKVDLDEVERYWRDRNLWDHGTHVSPIMLALVAELRASRKVLRELAEVDAEVGLLANVIGDWGSTEAGIDRATRAFESLRSLVNDMREEGK